MKQQLIGTKEVVRINGKKLSAKVDTGACSCSIDRRLVRKLNLHHGLVDIKKIKSSHGESYRPVVTAKVKVGRKNIPVRFNISERKNLKYPVLIGMNLLKRGFVVDATR